MASEPPHRKLAAILVADIVGFSRLIGADEEHILAQLRGLRRDLIEPTVATHRGRLVKGTGDGFILEFRSAVDATRCAVAIQSGMIDRNAGAAEDRRIVFRIGVHVGDVVEESDGDLMGDGVNVAARMEGVCSPGAICLSAAAYEQVRDKTNERFVDLGEKSLKNIARAVRLYQTSPGENSASTANAIFISSESPAIAVLPFENMSGDPEQDYFCDGLVEDIITTLSKLHGLRVIARNSSFVFKGRSVDVREASKQLGVRFLLEGSVRKYGNRIRVAVQLVDAKDGSHLWADRYDRDVADVFAIQDEITLVIATEMQVKLTEGEQARLRYTTTNNVEAWTHWVQGLSHYHHSITKDRIAAARRCWEKALALDPASATLHAMIGLTYVLDARFGWWEERDVATAKAEALIERALALEPDNVDGRIARSLALLSKGRYDEAAVEARAAVAFAPGAVDPSMLASFALVSSGYPEEAAALIQKAMSLSPNHPPTMYGNLGNALRMAGRLDEAIDAFEAYHQRSPGFGLVDLVLAYQQKGDPEKAKESAARLLAARRDFTIATWAKTQFIRRDIALLEADLAALRAAGLPEG